MSDDERRDVVHEYVTANTSGDSVVVMVFVVKDGRVASQHGHMQALGGDNKANVERFKGLGIGLAASAETILGETRR